MWRRLAVMLSLMMVLAGTSYAIDFSGLSLPKVQVGDQLQAVEVAVKAKDLELICPGAVYRSGGASGTRLGQLDPLGRAEVSVFKDPEQTSNLLFGSLGTDLEPFASSRGRLDLTTKESLRVVARDLEAQSIQGSQLLNGNQIQAVASERMAGLAGSSCQQPTTSAWILAGTTETGREALLVFANPSPVDATVDLEIFTEAGRVNAAGLAGISVAARSVAVVPVSALVPKAQSLAIRIQSRGAAVATWLQQKTVRGLVAAGLEISVPVAQPSNTVEIPGVLIRGSESSNNLAAADGDYGDLQPVLRVFATATTEVTGQIIGADSETFGTVVRETVSGGTVVDIPLTGLSDGDFSAFISADQPVLASIRYSRTTENQKPLTDFTWAPAGLKLTQGMRFVSPTSGITRLAISSSTDQAASLTLVERDTGAVINLNLEAGATSSEILQPGGNFEVTAVNGPVSANLVVDLAGNIATISIPDFANRPGERQLTIR